MWLMQQMNSILKINGLFHKMLDEGATTESTKVKMSQFSQQTTATICSNGKHSWYQLSKNHYDSTTNQKLIPHRSPRR